MELELALAEVARLLFVILPTLLSLLLPALLLALRLLLLLVVVVLGLLDRESTDALKFWSTVRARALESELAMITKMPAECQHCSMVSHVYCTCLTRELRERQLWG